MDVMTIGQVAKQTGISTDAIRLYERNGLLKEPERTRSGYRCYRQADIRRIVFIKRAKAMGFTLKEIKELLSIQRTSKHTCDDVKEQATIKLKNVHYKIHELKHMEEALQTLIQCCEDHTEDQECPILDALEQQISEVMKK